MTKRHQLHLESPKSIAASEAASDLDRLNAQTSGIRQAALSGNLTAGDLAGHTDKLNLAKLRAETASEAARDELGSLAPANTIADVVAEFLEDPALSATAVQEAAERLREVIASLEKANHERNTAITGWVKRLRDLGIPDHGLTVNGDELHILAAGAGSSSITVGAGRVSSVPNVAGHVRYLTQKATSRATMSIDPASLSNADTRSRARDAVTSVRLLKPIGGRTVGDTLTTKTYPLSVLAQMVHHGNAELIEGAIPDPSQHQRTLFAGDTSRLPDRQHVPTIKNVNDDLIVGAAVANAFTN